MGTLPPSSEREFESRIMVPQRGIEYMAGGTEFHRMIAKASLGGGERKNQKRWGREKSKSPPNAVVRLDNADFVIQGHEGPRRNHDAMGRALEIEEATGRTASDFR